MLRKIDTEGQRQPVGEVDQALRLSTITRLIAVSDWLYTQPHSCPGSHALLSLIRVQPAEQVTVALPF